MSKAIFGGISAVLLVAALVGVIAVVFQSNRSSSQNAWDDSMAPSSKSITAFCSPTDYSNLCKSTLSAAAKDYTSQDELILSVFNITFDEVKLAVNLTRHLLNKANDTRNKMALEDCRQLLEAAIDDFKVILSKVKDIHDIAKMSEDIKTWLSAGIAYQTTCIDGITQADIQEEMDSGLINATRLTSNAIAIVKELEPLAMTVNNAINKDRQTDPSGRRLLQKRQLLAEAGVTPNAVVAQDGSGQFSTIGDALNAVPPSYTGHYVIYVKAGLYKEYVNVTKEKKNIFMYGDGPEQTVVTGDRNSVDGLTTVNTPTFNVIADGFMCKGMGFRNTAGPEKHQAVALRLQSDNAIVHNCRMDGYQDTLYAHARRQFYSNCTITGTVDYIFGDACAMFQDCRLIVRRPMDNQKNAVTAHGRKEAQEATGFVFQKCEVLAEDKLFPDRLTIPSFLGRPWHPFARTVFMESDITDVIQPAGWLAWDSGAAGSDTCYYAEYANTGTGAATNARVKWPGHHVLGRDEAQQFTADNFIRGNEWVTLANVPYVAGF